MRSRIDIPSSGTIELYDDVSLSLNYAISDIKEPDKRDASFSKTINVPGTKNNNKLFSQIFDVGASGGFNPNIKTKAIIYCDSVPVFDGYLQLLDVTVDDQTKIEYQVVIFGSLANIYTVWANDELRDIDFSSLNHVWSKANVKATWISPTGSGYVYPLIDTGYTDGTYYQTEHFFPSIYLKEYIDRMFRYAGFTYTSNFFTSSFFKSLIVPFNGTVASRSNQQIINDTFSVNSSGVTTIPFPTMNYTRPWNNFVVTPSPAGQFNLSTEAWTVAVAGYYTLGLSESSTVSVNNPSGSNVNLSSNYKFTSIETILQNGKGISWISMIGTISLGSYAPGTTVIKSFNNVSNSYTGYFSVGDVVKVRVDTQFFAAIAPPGLSTSLNLSGSNAFYNIPSSTIVEGNTIDFSTVIPDKIKIAEVFTSVIRAFNLYVCDDPNKGNNLLIEPRNDFYTSGTIRDWSDKLDTSRTFDIKPMGALDAKDYYFTYKEDSDYWNERYQKTYNKKYGDRLISVNNDFLKDKKEVEIIFSPTPTVEFPLKSMRYIPQIIQKDQSGVASPKQGNIRLLQYSGLRASSTSFQFKSNTGNTFENSYPSATHLDNPTTPTIDLSFGVPEALFYFATLGVTSYTNNNLYNKYWKQFIDEITDKDSKIIVAHFYLTILDIFKLDFRDKFFVNGHYYRINRIMDFNPLSEEVTKVELIKIKEGIPFIPTTKINYTAYNDFGNGEIGAMWSPPIQKNGNSYNPETQIVQGYDNIVDPNAINVVLSGVGNIIGPSSGVNIFNSSGVTVSPNLTNVNVFNSSGITVSESNITYEDGVVRIPVTSGTLNQLIKYTPDSRHAGQSLIYDDGTNIGIGTTSPTSKLDVSGSLKFVTGNQGASKVLTSDASGNADWATLPAAGLYSPVLATQGGTGQTLYAIGDLLASSGTTASSLQRIASVSSGSYLLSTGVGAVPVWSTLKLPNAATTNNILYATATNTLGSSTSLTWSGTDLIASASGSGYIYKQASSNSAVSGLLAQNTGTQGNYITLAVYGSAYAGTSAGINRAGLCETGYFNNTSVLFRNPSATNMYFANNDTVWATITSAGMFGIGMTPTNILDITQTQNAGSIIKLLNNSSGAAAYSNSTLQATTALLTSTVFGSSYTTSGRNKQAGGLIECNGTGGLSLSTTSNIGEISYYTGTSSNLVFKIDSGGGVSITPFANGSVAPVPFKFTSAAHTILTASTEMTSVNWNTTATIQFSTGAIATQRSFLIQAPTYSFVGVSTISDAATFAISAAPIAGTNATITRSMALWVQAGSARFDSTIISYGSANNRAANNKILYGATTDSATAVELTIDGAAGSGTTNRIVVPTDATMSVVVNIAVKQTGSANSKQMLRQFLITNNAGTTTIEGAVTTLGTDVGSVGLATVKCTITANDTNDCIKIEVNGVAATNLRYTAFVVSTETTYT